MGKQVEEFKDLEERLLEEEEDKDYGLSYWQLVWRKFRRDKAALLGGGILILFYITMVFFAEFFAPYHLETRFIEHINAPPQRFHFIDTNGRFHLRPFVYGLKQEVDFESFTKVFKEDRSRVYPVRFFVRGDSYRLMGLFPGNIHLFGVEGQGTIFLFGTDRQGRDLFSRIFYGGRISLTVGLVGVFLSIFFGTVIGIASGYYGGTVDNIVQRSIEFLMSFPAIPLWMGLAAALPPDWSSIKVYFGITIILSVIGWGSLARQIRGKVLSLREEEYILAAKAMGAGEGSIIFTHLLPNCFSHIIVIATLSIPGMILGETSLSFLGLGIKPPMTSWGVLLQEAQNVRTVVQTPWLLIPVGFVILTVLCFNFLGDGLRDAADPFVRI
ncbi:MAG: ABC transporter permease [Firmicutes bacterium]|nr:ABC transporter permease [Bacillota bacterium]